MIPFNGEFVRWIPIDQISVVNPRARGRAKFRQITANIEKLGLKKPITVASRPSKDGVPRYDLVCGQGRLEAGRSLGWAEVPAIVIEAGKEDLLLMSLVENLARRRHVGLELVKEIAAMKDRGHDLDEIARLTDLEVGYVRGIIRLLNKGEERLLRAVNAGQIPVSVAITIASSDEDAVQRALAEAYEKNDLRGKALLRARRLIENRRRHGKAGRAKANGKAIAELSAEQLMKTYQRETARQRLVVRKSKLCETRLLFIVSALKKLLGDGNFVTLLRAERLDSMPQFLAEQVNGGKR
jgi:ParB family transcriptional regulator, chromosome partitioning protein